MSVHTRVQEIAVAVVFRGCHCLVARRSHGVHLGGMWEFPGGKILPRESPADAALRELWEECAVRAAVQRELAAVKYEYQDRTVRITPVICRWAAGEPRPIGSEECRWVDEQELSRLEMPPANAAIIQALRAARPGNSCGTGL